MACHQCTMAELESLIHQFPELVHIPVGRACHIHKVNGYDTLIEPAVVFFARYIIIGIGIVFFGTIHSQEGTASHTGVAGSIF